jgi:flagellar basal body-associated protein FliL
MKRNRNRKKKQSKISHNPKDKRAAIVLYIIMFIIALLALVMGYMMSMDLAG